MPDLVHDVIDIFKISPAKAKRLYDFYSPILSALALAPNPVAIKYIMQQLDMIKANLRKPLCLPEKKIKTLINKHIKSQLSI